jgi:hypothetical protein
MSGVIDQLGDCKEDPPCDYAHWVVSREVQTSPPILCASGLYSWEVGHDELLKPLWHSTAFDRS